MAKNKAYDNDSISSLKGADRVRLRPGVIFGSDDLEGCKHSFFEILSNSIDEAREGFGDTIEIRRFPDGSLEVEDHGRGIPLDYNSKEERYNWELVYCELYAGGKYTNNSGELYEFSLGLNGLGACATQYASEYFDVTVYRDSTRYSLHFEKGENIGGLNKESVRSKKTGTIQKWRPDTDVFTEIIIPIDFFRETLKRQAVINSGITFKLTDEETGITEEFCYPEGILGYVRELDDEKGISLPVIFENSGKGRDRKDKPEYRVKAAVAFCFNNENAVIEYYHNSSWLEYGGSPDKAVRSALVAEFDKQIKAQDKYKGNESKITFNDIQDSLILITSSFSTQTSYENQTKKAINNKFIQEFINDLLRTRLEIWFIENKSEADRVIEQILINKRSRENAEKQRLNIRKKLMGSVDMVNRIKNFVDCRTRDTNRRELYIVEGNSALGSCKMGRDADFQAIIPVRGKILNCLKADYNAIFKSDIIVDLIKVLGCGVEIQTKHNKDVSAFDLNNLRWNKVIICTDADVDGFQIRTLILAMFYRLTPTLIEQGKIFIAESPLFEITQKSRKEEKTWFAYDEREKNAILSQLGDNKCHIQRSKGLGENEPEMMWQTTMNPESRRLIEVVPEEASKTLEVFDRLLGDNLSARKQHIEENGHLYLDMLDI
ncbi:MAG: toprim domain-containing protein [Eubacteriales bacterium]|nr:toprim domain-containing protein [Eubacteriales bacterium]MDD3503965.1 toprim domain-containing protein [Eubacteriales bacterium]MDD4681556.1 toprim domain-containing protein [Eubacteriales bacterium]